MAAWALSLVLVLCFSVAYSVILGSIVHLDRVPLVVAGFAAAWTVGFLAVPIPAGFGIREIVLVAVIGTVYPSNVLVSASVFCRLTMLGVEGLLALVAVALRPTGRRSSPGGADAPGRSRA